MSGRIAVATSFAPSLVRTDMGRKMPDYDRLCIRSWAACGFRVLAMNGCDEIPALAARYPEIEFVTAPRNAREVFGRNTPFIADMMAVLASQPEPVLGIINSDLLFEPVPQWRTLEYLAGQKALVTGHRYDVRTLAGGVLHPYLPGFDYFFFDHAAADVLAKTDRPFSLGLPWWDYWFPLSLALRGYRLLTVTSPAVLHLAHESQTDARTDSWRRLAIEFARSMVQDRELGPIAHPNWDNFIALCGELDAASDDDLTSGACDEKIIHLSELAVPIVEGRSAVLEPPTVPMAREPSVLPSYFADMPTRIEAGRALHQALWEDHHDRPVAAFPLYKKALDLVPADPGVLLACGNFLASVGNLERAAILIGHAVDRAPDSAPLLNSLGATLRQLEREDDAITCFERALAADPHYGGAYLNLALALQPRGKEGEIIARLEAELQHPDFADGASWLRRIREALLPITIS